MLPKRLTPPLACEAVTVAALAAALAGLTLDMHLLGCAGLCVAVPAYALCVFLSARADRRARAVQPPDSHGPRHPPGHPRPAGRVDERAA